jgi:hypothetical protein
MIALYFENHIIHFGLDIFCGQKAFVDFFFPRGSTVPSRPRPFLFLDFAITLRHTTFGRVPLDEWSARRRDLYLTTHNTHKRQASITPAAFELAISASQLEATTFRLVVTGICSGQYTSNRGLWQQLLYQLVKQFVSIWLGLFLMTGLLRYFFVWI